MEMLANAPGLRRADDAGKFIFGSLFHPLKAAELPQQFRQGFITDPWYIP